MIFIRFLMEKSYFLLKILLNYKCFFFKYYSTLNVLLEHETIALSYLQETIIIRKYKQIENTNEMMKKYGIFFHYINTFSTFTSICLEPFSQTTKRIKEIKDKTKQKSIDVFRSFSLNLGIFHLLENVRRSKRERKKQLKNTLKNKRDKRKYMNRCIKEKKEKEKLKTRQRTLYTHT